MILVSWLAVSTVLLLASSAAAQEYCSPVCSNPNLPFFNTAIAYVTKQAAF
jgi:hypothetical protein